MTDLPVVDRSVSFIATGGETILDVDWPIASSTELTVTRTRAGVTSTLLEVTDYVVEGVGSTRGAQVRLVLSAERGDAYQVTGLEGAGSEGSGSQLVTFVLARWRGAFAMSTLYRRGDAVEVGGQSYVALVSHVSSSADAPASGPSWTAHWALVAAKGDAGAPGTAGAPGASGAPGAPGEDGEPGPGLPAGGAAGQFPRKASGNDYDIEWSDNVPKLGVNATADATNKLSVKSDAVLFSHDDVTPGTGDQRTILNKSASDKTASFLFQSNWSGRAEIGLAGNDDFSFKVSPDGDTWHEALILKNDGSAITAGLPVQHAKPPKLPAYTIETLPSASTYGAGSLIYASDWRGGDCVLLSDGVAWQPLPRQRGRVADILGRDKGIAIDFRAREARINDGADVLTVSGRLVDVLTLTRASDATFFGRNGLIETAGSNTLRYAYDPVSRQPRGLLLEGAATNRFLQSRFAASWNTSRSTKTAGDTLGKDGTMGAATLTVDNTASSTHYIYQSVSFESGKKYCKSIFAKAGTQVGDGGRYLLFGPDTTNFTETGTVHFDLVGGVVSGGTGTVYSGGQYGMIDLGDGWHLCWVWVTAQATSSVNQVFYMAKSSGSATFDGNGQDSIHIDEAQFEEGTAPSSRIRTTAATATRSADSVVIGPDTFPVLGSGDATLYWRGRIRQLCGSGEGTFLSANDDTTDEVIAFREGASLGGIDATVIDGGSTVSDTDTHAIALGYDFAAAVSVRDDDLKLYIDGAEAATDASLTAPTIDQLTITPGAGSIYEIDEIAYMARALSAAELPTLSTV
jgi:hypothetical protein